MLLIAVTSFSLLAVPAQRHVLAVLDYVWPAASLIQVPRPGSTLVDTQRQCQWR